MKTGERWLGLAVVLVLALTGAARADLVARWDFNEGTGTTAADVTANGHDGTLESADWGAGVDGSAVSFNQTAVGGKVTIADVNDDLSAGDLRNGGGWSFSTWAKISVLGDNSSDLYYGITDAQNYMFVRVMASGRVRFHYEINDLRLYTDYASIDYAVKENEWTHIVVAIDGDAPEGSQIKFYINNVDATVNGTIDLLTYSMDLPNSTKTIGYSASYGLKDGDMIDDTRIYNHALSAAEVETLYYEFAGHPKHLSPANGSVGVDPATVTLNWEATVSDGGQYDVYFGTDPEALVEVDPNSIATSWSPAGSLNLTTDYYWRVDGIKQNPFIWTFRTGGQSADPVPVDNGVARSDTAVLDWADDNLALSFNVYWGTSEAAVTAATTASPEFKGNVTASDTSNLTLPVFSEGQTWYWRVDTITASLGTAKGDTWSFSIGGLVVHWNFDEGSGTTLTDTATTLDGAQNGTLYNSPVWTGGLFNGALEFSSATETYVDVPDDDSLDMGNHDITFSFWARKNQAGVRERFYSKRNTDASTVSNDLYVEATASNIVQCRAVSDGFTGLILTSDAAYPLDPNDWTHIAIVVDRDSVENTAIYLNGIDRTASSITLTFDPAEALVNNESVNLGRYASYVGSTPSMYLNGKMDDFRIYNIALTQAEVQALYEASPLAQYPSPPDKGYASSLDADLSWTAGVGAGSHQVYFQADSPTFSETPNAILSLGTETWDPGALTAGTTYYWRVDEVSVSDTVTGVVWQFTAPTCTLTAAEGDINGDCIVDLDDFAVIAGNWLLCGKNPSSLCP